MKTAVATSAPDPHQELVNLLAALLERKLHSEFTPNHWPWHEIPYMVQLRLAVWDPRRGWLTTRRGITHSGPARIDQDPFTLEEEIVREVRMALRAMRHRWNEP